MCLSIASNDVHLCDKDSQRPTANCVRIISLMFSDAKFNKFKILLSYVCWLDSTLTDSDTVLLILPIRRPTGPDVGLSRPLILLFVYMFRLPKEISVILIPFHVRITQPINKPKLNAGCGSGLLYEVQFFPHRCRCLLYFYSIESPASHIIYKFMNER